MKKLFLIILLFVSIPCFSQFQFDSVQVKKIRLIIEENKFFHTENDSLQSRIAIYDKKISLLNFENEMQDTIINLKERQLRLLENRGIEVKEIKTGFFTWAGVIVSSIATGLIIGVIIK